MLLEFSLHHGEEILNEVSLQEAVVNQSGRLEVREGVHSYLRGVAVRISFGQIRERRLWEIYMANISRSVDPG